MLTFRPGCGRSDVSRGALRQVGEERFDAIVLDPARLVFATALDAVNACERLGSSMCRAIRRRSRATARGSWRAGSNLTTLRELDLFPTPRASRQWHDLIEEKR